MNSEEKPKKEHEIRRQIREEVTKELHDSRRETMATIRTVQAIFVGIFVLGLSMIVGDFVGYVEIPISSMSISTTMFGGFGSVVCEVAARSAENW